MRNEMHYLTSPEQEWRCAECQWMCYDDSRCPCCQPVVHVSDIRDRIVKAIEAEKVPESNDYRFIWNMALEKAVQIVRVTK